MKHFVLLLFAGDYLDAAHRRAEGQSDRYRHHSYALDTLTRLREQGDNVSVVQMRSPAVYDQVALGGIRFLGLGDTSAVESAAAIGRYLREEQASHVMARFPSVEVLAEIERGPARASVVLADSFPSPRRNRQRYSELGRLLSAPGIDLVSNHHLAASRQLVDRLGVPASKVVPWDWPLDLREVAATSAKPHPGADVMRLCFAGSIGRAKGVWDLLMAGWLLRRRGVQLTVDLAGSGDEQKLSKIVDRLRLRDVVRFHGRVGGDDILAMMQASSFVCVPSRHSYPEGLPLTLYEAMASGTPLVASDHPMFRQVLRDGDNAFVFRAGRPDRLAAAVLRGWRDPEAYERVSSRAASTYAQIGHPTLWGDLLEHWVSGTHDDVAWLRDRSLSAAG